MKKILYILFSGILIIGLGLAICWTVINFNKVEDGLSGAGIYTEEDLNNSYNDGYNTALSDKEEYTKLIDSYRDTITSNTDEISKLNNQVSILTKNNKDYASQISDLETQKITLEEQVVNLTTIKTSNETTISLLEGQVSTLQKEVDSLNADNSEQASLIKQKNIQIINLQNTISQLQKTNELNLETINNLNNQITSLNTQITSMSLQIQNNSTNVTALNNKIAELEKSVAYYEQYIANLEVGEQIVITFEFNGSVYNIQIINKNATVSVVNPTSTDYVVFNGWTVDDNFIDLNTYSFTSNTKVVADITYKYDVKFMIDDSEFATQIVTENNCPVLPANPTKNGFVFDGWTLNGFDIVSPDNTIITENTIFIAKFTKLHTVTFVYEDSTYSTQTIRNNECPTNVIIESTDYKIFNGWTLNSVVVDVTTQKIVSNTTFVADITYKYDVKFMVDDSEISSQIILENDYPVLPTNPTKNGFVFDGWT